MNINKLQHVWIRTSIAETAFAFHIPNAVMASDSVKTLPMNMIAKVCITDKTMTSNCLQAWSHFLYNMEELKKCIFLLENVVA